MPLPLLAAAITAVLGIAPSPTASPQSPPAAEVTRTIRVELKPQGTHVDKQRDSLTVEVGYDEGPSFGGWPSSPWVAPKHVVQRLEIAPDETTWIELEVPERVLAQPSPSIWARFNEPTFTRQRSYARVSKTDADVFKLWLTGHGGFSLEGQVHYPDGAPAEDGVKVQVAKDLGRDWPEYPERLGKLGPDGRFHLACDGYGGSLTWRTAVVRAKHPVLGFGPAVEVTLRVQGEPSKGNLDVQLELPARGVLGGVLETADGTPVPGAQLRAVPALHVLEDSHEFEPATVTTDSLGRFHFSALRPGLPHHIFLLRPRHAALPECLTEGPRLPVEPLEMPAGLTLVTRTPHLVVSARAADGSAIALNGDFRALARCTPADRRALPSDPGLAALHWTATKRLLPDASNFQYFSGPWWLPRPRTGGGSSWQWLEDGRAVLAMTPGEVLLLDLIGADGGTAEARVHAPASGLVEQHLTLGPPTDLATLRVPRDILPGDSELVVYDTAGTPVAVAMGVVSGMCGLSYMIERPPTIDLFLPPGPYRLVLTKSDPYGDKHFAPRVTELRLGPGETRDLEELPEEFDVRLRVRFGERDSTTEARFEGQERWADLLGKHALDELLEPLGRPSDPSYVGARLTLLGEDPAGLHDFQVTISLEPIDLHLPWDDYRVVLELPGREPLELEAKAIDDPLLLFEL